MSVICRLCLQESITLISLHTKDESAGECSTPYEKLHNILKIEVNDVGSSWICSECLQELEDCVKFVNKCKSANKILTSEFNSCKPLSAQNESLNQDCDDPGIRTIPEATDVDAEIKPVTHSTGQQQKATKPCSKCKSKRSCIHCPPTVYTCHFCQKDFTRKFNYNIHVKRHLGQRDYPCVGCGLPQMSSWLARTHCAPRRRQTCPYSGCERSYTSTHNLTTHVRSYTGERPHECLECKKRFSSKNTLKDHIKTHTGALPFLCSVCGARFATNKLAAHLRTHSPSRSHAPPRTLRPSRSHAHSAPEQSDLQIRWRRRCELCARRRRYAHKQSLNRHLRKRHPAQVPDCSEENLKVIDCFM